MNTMRMTLFGLLLVAGIVATVRCGDGPVAEARYLETFCGFEGSLTGATDERAQEIVDTLKYLDPPEHYAAINTATITLMEGFAEGKTWPELIVEAIAFGAALEESGLDAACNPDTEQGLVLEGE